VIVTKDNLAKQNRHGSKKWVVYYLDKTIKHLFFQYCFARSIWSVMQVASTWYPLCSVVNIFGSCLYGLDHRFKKYIRVGVITIIWSLWLYKIIKCLIIKNSYFLQVIHRVQILSVCGHPFGVLRVETCLWRLFYG
jgi:hypothetical protein